MILTKKGKYAITAIIDLATNYSDGPIKLSDISIRQGISVSYLEQIFLKLKRNGLVKSCKGPGGGYILSKNIVEIKILDIIIAVEENLDARTCKGVLNCKENSKCVVHDLLNGLTIHLYSYLKSISLNDLLSNTTKYNNINNKFIKLII